MAHHPYHTVQIIEIEGRHHYQPLREPDTAVERKGYQRDNRHKSQAAQLDHTQNNRLTEKGPLDGGVHQNQSGYTGGGSGGKEGCEKTCALSVPRGNGQRQQQRAYQDNDSKGPRHNTGGIQAFAFDQAIPQPEGNVLQHKRASP